MPLEIEGNDKRGALLRSAPVLVLAFSLAVLGTVVYIQGNRVSGPFEVAGRTCAAIIGLLVVPAFLFLAAKIWAVTHRATLPQWRNGLGLSSLVTASLVWMIFWGSLILSLIWRVFHFYFLKLDFFSWVETLLCANLLAGLLATALKGNSRVLVIGAVILTYAGIAAGIIGSQLGPG